MSHVTHMTYESCHTNDARHWRYSNERCSVVVLQCSSWCCSVPRYSYEHRVIVLQLCSVAVFLICCSVPHYSYEHRVIGLQLCSVAMFLICCSVPHYSYQHRVIVLQWCSVAVFLICCSVPHYSYEHRVIHPRSFLVVGLRPHIHPFV